MPLTCTPASLTAPPAPDALTLQRVDAYSGAEALAELAEATGAARVDLGDGDLGVLVRMGTTPTGGGWFTSAEGDAGGVARIVAVGITPGHEELGLEALVAAELARLAFRTGVAVVELDVGDGDGPGAADRYAPAGFTPTS